MPDIHAAVIFKNILATCVFSGCIFFIPAVVQSSTSNTATLQWAANLEPDLAGYRIYHGTSPGIYGSSQSIGKTTSYQYANLESNKTHYFTVTAYDTAGNESLPSSEVSKIITVSSSQPAPSTSTGSDSETGQSLSLPINATFESGLEGFRYLDDTFRGTNQPGYASGNLTTSSFRGQGLRVALGGLDNVRIVGMSGGWQAKFQLTAPTAVQLKFRYNLTQSLPYENDEFSQVVVKVAGLQPGTGGKDYVAQLSDGGTTGWQFFQTSLGVLPAGTHTLTLGAYNNQKTASDELTEVFFDDVVLQKASGTSNQATSTNVFWRNTTSGEVAVWLMNGLTITSVGFPGSSSVDWRIERVGDLNGDGQMDVLWRNSFTGVVAVWLMNEGKIISSGYLGGVPAEWVVKGVGDVNGDNKADVLWRNSKNGMIAVWLMNGLTLTSVVYLGSAPTAWDLEKIGDVNGDGKTDLVWQNQTDGTVAVWLMNGLNIMSVGFPASTSTEWKMQSMGDVNGDGRSDVVWRNSKTGMVAVWVMNGSTISSYHFVGGVPFEWEIKQMSDMNGDGKADVVLLNKLSGKVAVWIMNGSNISSVGFPGSTPVYWKIHH